MIYFIDVMIDFFSSKSFVCLLPVLFYDIIKETKTNIFQIFKFCSINSFFNLSNFYLYSESFKDVLLLGFFSLLCKSLDDFSKTDVAVFGNIYYLISMNSLAAVQRTVSTLDIRPDRANKSPMRRLNMPP